MPAHTPRMIFFPWSVFIGGADLFFFVRWISEVYFIIQELVQSDQRRLGHTLVMLGYLDLFPILKYFFQIIVRRSELLQLTIELLLELHSNLVSTLANDHDGFVQVAGFFIDLT